MKKKLITLLLVVALAVCLSVVAFAEEPALDATPGYRIDLIPSAASVDHGNEVVVRAELNGLFGDRTLTGLGTFCGVTVDPEDQGVTAAITGPSTVTITVTDDSEVGDYTITVWAVSTFGDIGANATADFELTVGHALCEHQDGLPAGCYTAGYKEYYQCPSCGLYFEDEYAETEIGDADALAAWQAEGGNGYLAPLDHCTEEGSAILPAGGKVPTCTEDGCKEYYYCPLCTYFLADAEGTEIIGLEQEDVDAWAADPEGGLLPALGHDLGEWVDCEDHYWHHARTCSRCDYTEIEEHDWDAGTDIGGGKTKYVCDVCGCTLIEGGEPAPAKPQAPKTGDESNLVLWAVSALVLGSAAVVLLKKKEN